MTWALFTGKATAPRGPLDVNDVFKDKCKLKWKKPKDDGGSGILEYLVEKLDTAKGVWTEVARVDGDTPHCDVDK